MKVECIEVKILSEMGNKWFSQNIKNISETIGIIGCNMEFRVGKVEFKRRKSETLKHVNPKRAWVGKLSLHARLRSWSAKSDCERDSFVEALLLQACPQVPIGGLGAVVVQTYHHIQKYERNLGS